jgi:tetratricopeptide (TPR) repeat protein/O-antigen ligase
MAITAILCAAAFGLTTIIATVERRRISIPRASILLAAIGVITILQVIPVGQSVTDFLGGESNWLTSEALKKTGITGAWRSISVEPVESMIRASWMILAAGFLIAGTVLAKSSRKTTLILSTVAAAGLLQFCIGLVNMFGHVNVLADLLPYQTRLADGFHTSMVNSNHSAALFNLSAFAALALGLRTTERLKKWLWYGVTALMAAGTVITWSRGGTLALLGFLLPLLVYVQTRERLALSEKRTKILAVTGLVLIGLATLVVSENALNSFGSKSFGYDSWESKRSVWQDAVCLTLENPLTGAGNGAFSTAVSKCRSVHSEKRADFAENIVLQTFAELGIPVGILITIFALWLFVRLLRRNWHRPHKIAIWAGIACVTLQNMADFSLFIPGVGLPFLAFVFILSCRGKRSDCITAEHGWIKTAGAVAVIAALTSGLCLSGNSIKAAEARAVLSVKDTDNEDRLAGIIYDIRLHPGDPLLYTLAAVAADDKGRDPVSGLHLVEAALILNPGDFTAGIIKARLLATRGKYQGATVELFRLFKQHPQRENEIFRVILLSAIPDAELAKRTDVDEEFLTRYCLFMDRNRMPERCFKLLTAASDIRKDDLNILKQIAQRLLNVGKVEKADAVAARIVAIAPDSPEGYIMSGKVLTVRNQLVEAEALFAEALRIDDANVPAKFGLLRILMLANRFAEFDTLAKDTGALLVKERGARADLLLLMAARSRRANETGNAVDQLNKAILLAPDRPSIYVELGDTLMLQRRRQEAVNAWKSALELRPGYEPAMKRLGAQQAAPAQQAQ